MSTKRLLLLAVAVALAGCSLDKQVEPALAGPSELGLSLALTATPDIVSQDGRSEAVIAIVARNANGRPVAGLGLQLETVVSGIVVDFGTLSTKSLSTGDDGRATVVYRSPAAPPPTTTDDTVVSVVATPLGTNYLNETSRVVTIRLTRPGVILPPNGTPVASFIFSPAAPKQDDNILFDASASTDDGRIVRYTWNFGDGPAENDGLPQTTHRYSAPGTYNVVLTVTDDQGLSASTAPEPVQVGGAPTATASFTFSPTLPIVNQAVNFNGSASTSSAGHHIVSYDWDFGDGSPHGAGVTPQHVYAVPGTYTVVLDIADDGGRVGVGSSTIAVASASPKAVFTISPPSPNAGALVQFSAAQSTAAAGNTITSYQWDFGDGTRSTGTSTSHVYSDAGTFVVQLIVTDNTGATGVTTSSVTVNP